MLTWIPAVSGALQFKVQPATYFYVHVDMGKKRKGSATGERDRLPHQPRDAWLRRMAVSAANPLPVTRPTSKKKPPAGRHRWDEAESRPSSLRFIDSFRPGAVSHNRSQSEIGNSFIRNVTLRLCLPGAGRTSSHCTNTLTPELKRAKQGGIKSNINDERSPLSKKKTTKNTGARKVMERWEARRRLRWTSWIWKRLGSAW